LRTYGCENNILMADAVMLKRTLNATPEAFRNAGRRYAVVPVQVAGCFHPKVHLRLGTDGARLIVGSANATAAGWGSNHEIVTAIDWRTKSDTAPSVALGSLIRRSYDYLTHWLEAVPGDAVDFKLRLHRRDSPWLEDLEVNAAPVELEDGTAIDLFCERGGDETGMMTRLLSLTWGEKASRLVVISPYWDAKLDGLLEIQQNLPSCRTIIALNPALNEFPITALDKTSEVIFASIHDGSEGHRFIHAKVILIQTDKADHVLFGSANCSDDAIGGARLRARNAEVSIYRRFPPGEGLNHLRLDLSRTVERSNIRSPEPNKQMFQSGASAVPAGSVEVVEKSLTWWPPQNAKTIGAAILFGEDAIPTAPIGNGQYRAFLITEPTFPFVVRVCFGDGRVSDPLIVHDETALRIASPGITDRRLRNAFNRVLQGEEDVIDLAFQAHLIFEPSGNQPAQIVRATGASDRSAPEVTNKDYLTAEAFREGVSLKPANGQSGRFSIDDPGLLDLLTIILRGVTDVGGRDGRKRQDEEEDSDYRAGEDEDGDELNAEEPLGSEAGTPQVASAPVQRTFTPAQIERRKSQLKKAISAFEKMLEKLSAETSAVSTRLTAQTAFILNLMLYACTKDHPKVDGQTVRLMEFAPGPSSDRDLAFAVRAGKILQTIWISGKNGPVIDRLQVDLRRGSMPDDVFFFVVMSRWAIARACIATVDVPGQAGIGRILQATAVKIYLASLRFGLLDGEDEHRFIGKLDEALGFSQAETASLLNECRRFAAIVAGGTVQKAAETCQLPAQPARSRR
jgi:hypothetical protein